MKKLKRNIILFFISVFMINMFTGVLCTTAHAGSSYSTADEIGYGENYLGAIPEGDYWLKIRVDEMSDLYISVNYNWAYEDSYTELYSPSLILLAGDYALSHKQFVAKNGIGSGMYYIKLHTPYGEDPVIVNVERFNVCDGAHEPNNWFELATQMTELDTGWDIIFEDSLGDNGDDIDIYKYTPVEPCMLAVHMLEHEDNLEFDIYIDDFALATTNRLFPGPKKIERDDVFYFNHIKGPCYIVVYGGWGEYKMQITKLAYQADPILYHVSPQTRQIISELDAITPKAALLGEGTFKVESHYVKNGNGYSSTTGYPTVNSRSFTEYQFPTILPSQVSDEKNGSQNSMQISAQNTSKAKGWATSFYYLIYDNEPPECDDVIVSKNEDSIEISIVNAYDKVKLAQRPYRYRVYPFGNNPPEYSDWITSNYYNQWLDNEAAGNMDSYVIDVQIRDSVAEKYQSSTKDLSKHILTVTKAASSD